MDDDGRVRTGTLWSATTHAITAVIGSGVLALPWSVAQMGWVMGPLALVGFALVTYYTATLLCDCYRTPDPVHGSRNHTYMDVVRACLGKREVFMCGLVQYAILWGVMVGYTVTVAMSMMAVERATCMHSNGQNQGGSCQQQSMSGVKYIALFGLAQIFLSQFPSLEKVTFLSLLAAAMSFAYSSIALCLSVVKLVSGGGHARGSLLGVIGGGGAAISAPTRAWQGFQALGNIAFAYTYAMLLVEIQDTLKSPPAENKTMKRASLYGIGVTTAFYVSLGCVGYAAFGDNSPGNVLTGFVNEPFWLVNAANIAVVVHLVGAYQVYAQPVFAKYESYLAANFPNSSFLTHAYTVPLPFRKPASLKLSPSRLLLRTAFVAFTTLVAAALPFFNAIVGLLGAVAFWPLTVYFPVSIYMIQAKVKRGQFKWVGLNALSAVALLVSLAAAVGSVADIAQRLRHAKLFQLQI